MEAREREARANSDLCTSQPLACVLASRRRQHYPPKSARTAPWATREAAISRISWPWRRASKEWSFDTFKGLHGVAPSHAGGFEISLADYIRYAESAAGDDQPLYLFDKAILANELGGQYEARRGSRAGVA